ncbi:MAG: DUF3313 family protein [Pseudomonadales bacterium]
MSNGSEFLTRARVVLWIVVGLMLTSAAAAQKPPEVSHDGLHLVHDTELQLVYLKPGVDFDQYTSVKLLDCTVSFRRNWQRDQSRMGSSRVTKMDMDDISRALSKMFGNVMREEIQTSGKLQWVEEVDESTLILRPAIINLDITVPDASMGPGQKGAFSTSAGSMTLYLEIFDGLTGEILARVADRQTERSSRMTWHDSVTNTADAKRVIKAWAVSLREGMQQVRQLSAPAVAPEATSTE